MTKREQLIAFDSKRWHLCKQFPRQFLSAIRRLIKEGKVTYFPHDDTFQNNVFE